jgi:phosphoglucomutase
VSDQTALEKYQQWCEQPHLPADLKSDLEAIQGDEKAIVSRFGTDLDFGTGGMRGVMGAGLNRMNIYTVRRASFALAQHVLAKGADKAKQGVVIGYDCRHNSDIFARIAGCALAAAGVKAYVSPLLCPTPELSWCVRYLHAAGGIMITASHNPPAYNGYKVYNQHGGQVLEDDAHDIHSHMLAISDVFSVPTVTVEEATAKGLYETVSTTVRAAYLEAVLANVKDGRVQAADREKLYVVYTPLHGTGLVPIREALHAAGYEHTQVVPSQAEPDGDFSTVKSPNPEEPEALELAIAQAKATGADLVMGSDPDADRVGIAVRAQKDEFRLLTGNQVGALLVDYFVGKQAQGEPRRNPIVFNTVVTSDFGAAIAQQAGVAVESTLTGFKYIGDRITAYEASGEHELLVGYEESYGYLVSPIVRDKDAVQSCLAIAEMAAYHKASGRTLVDRLEELYQKYGYYGEKLVSVALSGEDGPARMQQALESLRKEPLTVSGFHLAYTEDYLTRERHFVDKTKPDEALTLPKSDVQKFVYQGGHWVAIRPSGTEPKMKVYVAVRGKSHDECDALLKRLEDGLASRVHV